MVKKYKGQILPSDRTPELLDYIYLTVIIIGLIIMLFKV